ncbi:hypothetical protein [Streptomyces albireticuli]|uniref:hypothetical protein n=1 Tax=Streptomyces albireticuli TaxID=1940 RepID=UPI001180451A|nr:hypothetical protein [Streptomyces albireticuli]MCD9145642.1 hypothetical protein [Streptomyces albireticuli]MCD9165626.1 hypothetical protein [Streptomyces albireticuli]MCD9196319.1 hypothetical protein [Streptomyces albireticuli]
MSFSVYARRVRDRGLPLARRHRALRDAVGLYCPLGFHGTWAHLGTAGDLRNDERALLRAMEMLEASRRVRMREAEAFAAHRRAEKARQRRTPPRAQVRYLYGPRWPGPQGKPVMLAEVGRLWAEFAPRPFPDVPREDKSALAWLDASLAGCVSVYLANGGSLDAGRRRVVTEQVPALRRQLPRLGYRSGFPEAFGYFHDLIKMTELVANSLSEGLAGVERERLGPGPAGAEPGRNPAISGS